MKDVTCDEEKNCFVDMDNTKGEIPEDLLPMKSFKTAKKRRSRRTAIKGKGKRKRCSLKKPFAVTRRRRKRTKKAKKLSHKKTRRVKRKR